MGFGDLVAKTQADEASTSPRIDLKQVILDHYERKEVRPPPDLKNLYYRASGLAYVCPRQEVLRNVHQVSVHVLKPAEELANYDVGTGMHHVMQNLILPDPEVDVLRGAWRCVSCGHVHGELVGRAVYDAAIRRPSSCFECGGKEFLYKEYFLQDPVLGTGGHMDGLLVLPGYDGMGLFELKSISQNGARKVKNCPQMEHVIQANVYMHLANLRWAKILYWVKGVYALDKNLIEHHLEPDPEVWGRVEAMLRSIRSGMETGELPDRICAHRTCEMAQSCPVLNQCFGDVDPDNVIGII